MRKEKLKIEHEDLIEDLDYYKSRVNEHSQMRPADSAMMGSWSTMWNNLHSLVDGAQKALKKWEDKNPEYFV